jgi:hypothetical protein
MPAIPDSILDTTKKVLGISADYDAFDVDVLMHINSVFSTLQQIGAGPAEGFMIEDSSVLWSTYLGPNSMHLNLIKSYMFVKVRLLFDINATTSFVIAALEKQASEMEWRISIAVENGELTPLPSLYPIVVEEVV